MPKIPAEAHIPPAGKRDIARELGQIDTLVFDQMIDVLENGADRERVSAAKFLKEWRDNLGLETVDTHVTIGFDLVTAGDIFEKLHIEHAPELDPDDERISPSPVSGNSGANGDYPPPGQPQNPGGGPALGQNNGDCAVSDA